MTGLLLVGAVAAHTLAPARATLEEGPAGWQVVLWGPQAALGTLAVSVPCPSERPVVSLDSQRFVSEQRLDCAAAPEHATITGIAESGSPVLLELATPAGTGRVLVTVDGEVPLPRPSAPWEHGVRYLRAGAEHVLLGLDHVLVVLGLTAAAGRRALRVVTGFTVGHSLTLVACALGWLSVPTALAEGLIAISLVALADQLVRERAERGGMAVLLGLLHGLGFGGGLAALGLPMEQTGLALLSFNLGVEVGQLVVIGAAVLWMRQVGRGGIRALAGALAAVGTFLLLEAVFF